jgi:predicted nucleic acid-binding protein
VTAPQPRVLDHTALVALFNGNHDVFGMWEEADRGEAGVVLPAVAIAEATHLVGADDDAWRALLYPATVAPLGQAQAIAAGQGVGSLVVRHVIVEVRSAKGVIVTRAPWQYPADVGPMRVI